MQDHEVVETATATRKLVRPYQVGLPLAHDRTDPRRTWSPRSSQRPDLIVRQRGWTRPHARRGLAIQLGAAIDVPTVGVTEHPEIGEAPEPDTHRGDWTPVRVDNRLVGFRVRTVVEGQPRDGARRMARPPRRPPATSVLRTTGRQRMPEPLQRARDLSRRLRSEYERGARRPACETGSMADAEADCVTETRGRSGMKNADWPVAIVGAGTMGHGIAQVAARQGFEVRLYDESSEALGAAKSGIELTLDRGLARGVVTREEKEETLARITFVDTLEEAVKGCRVVIEAVPEDPAIKRPVFERLDELAPRDHDPRVEHVRAQHHDDRQLDAAPGAGGRTALLQSRPIACRWWRSSKGSRPATRPSNARGGSVGSSGRRRSSSPTDPGSRPAG